MLNITINNQVIQVPKGARLIDVIKDENKEILVAKVNNRLRELTYALTFDSEVKPLSYTSSDAIKVYETSVRYLVSMAFRNLFPNLQLKISYGISRSIYISLPSPSKFDSKMIQALKAEMQRIVDLDLPFERYAMSREEAHDYFVANNYPDKAQALVYRPDKICHFHKCGDFINYMYGYVVPSTGYIKFLKIFPYGDGVIIQYPRHEAGGKIPVFNDEPTFARVLKRSYSWAKRCNSHFVYDINKHLENDTYVDCINMNETLHNDMLHELGGKIESDIENIRLICIAGPSSSGKTTFSK